MRNAFALAGPSSRAYCACGAALRRPRLVRGLSTDIDAERVDELDFRSVEAELVRRKAKADYKRSKVPLRPSC